MEEGSTAVATREATGTVMQYIKSPAVVEALRVGCSKHLTPERLVRVACAALARQPQLMDCTKESLYLALTNCGQLGLEPNLLGAAYLVPYRNNKTGKTEAQFIPGYRGLIELARRSGQIKTIEAHVVREKDEFAWTVGQMPIHNPYLGDEEPGAMRLVWSMAVFTDGAYQVEVLTRREVDKVRASSRAGQAGPWVQHYEEMAKKTAVRRLAKYLPLTIELTTALEADIHAEIQPAQEIDVTPVEQERKTSKAARIAEKLKTTVDESVDSAANIDRFKVISQIMEARAFFPKEFTTAINRMGLPAEKWAEAATVPELINILSDMKDSSNN